ncbi:MAG: HAD family phosphatase [Bacteroidales bacterium]|jgi:putative hydrolase of the HAD superfamily|nr:HAD family phosphatase [Bacteroidales bacterium]
MIRNIVFDLGNVLLSFKPKEYLERKEYSVRQTEKILTDIFLSPEWPTLDNGDITHNEAIERIAERSSLSKTEIAGIFDLRINLLFPLEKNVTLLPELKQKGYKLYYLSNFTSDIFPEIRSLNPFFNIFDGGIISADVRVSKPDETIYRLLVGKYSLVASESLFIDDLEINVRAAEKTGMQGLHTNGAEDIGAMLWKILAGS